MSDISFTTGNDISVAGTKRVGMVTATYNHLVETFGKPSENDFEETHIKWHIQFRVPAEDDPDEFDIVVATIYDWMLPQDPRSVPNEPIEFMVGGHDIQATYYVHLVLG